MRTYRTL